MTLEERAVRHVRSHPVKFAAGIADDRVLARHDCGEIDADGASVHAEIRGAPREVSGIGAGDQRLGRRAAGVDAGSPDQLALISATFRPAAASRPAIGGPAWPSRPRWRRSGDLPRRPDNDEPKDDGATSPQ